MKNEVKHREEGKRIRGKEAIWQYIIDHAIPAIGKKGQPVMKITFYLRDRNHWENCIYWRKEGVYRRDEDMLKKEFAKLSYVRERTAAFGAAHQARTHYLKNEAPFYLRWMFYVQKATYRYLFKEVELLAFKHKKNVQQNSPGDIDRGTGRIDCVKEDQN